MLLRFTYMYVNNTLTDGDVVRVRTRTFKPMVVVVDVVVVVVVVTFPARVSSKRWHHYRWCVCVSGGVARLPGLVFAL